MPGAYCPHRGAGGGAGEDRAVSLWRRDRRRYAGARPRHHDPHSPRSSQVTETDFDILASRAVKPYFYHAPYPTDSGYVLKEYQHSGAEYCLARNHALIGDAPGVGKTAQAIVVSNAIRAKRTLVVCPAS